MTFSTKTSILEMTIGKRGESTDGEYYSNQGACKVFDHT